MKHTLVMFLALMLIGCQPLAAYEPTSTQAATVTNTPRHTAKPPTPAKVYPVDFCTVTAAEALNLRSGPGTKYTVKHVLEAGAILTRLPTTNGDWWKVTTQDDLTGWIHSKYCKE